MKLKFLRKQHEVGEVFSFYFTSEDLKNWLPGQYLNLTMPDIPPVYADRLFTIASAPHEDIIQITTIIGPSPFKQKLNSLKKGDEVEADQLGGDFTWDAVPSALSNDEVTGSSVIPAQAVTQAKRLFIAGGIGVTPYISIIRDKLHRNQPLDATLLYAGKSESRPFLEELAQAETKDESFKVKHYESTRLTLEQLLKDIPDIQNYIVYLAGSQKFSETIGEGLIATGFPRSQIKYDYFDGYTSLEY